MPNIAKLSQQLERAENLYQQCNKFMQEKANKGLHYSQEILDEWNFIRQARSRVEQELRRKQLTVNEAELQEGIRRLEGLMQKIDCPMVEETKDYSNKIFKGLGKIFSLFLNPKAQQDTENFGGIPRMFVEGLVSILTGFVGLLFGSKIAETMGKYLKPVIKGSRQERDTDHNAEEMQRVPAQMSSRGQMASCSFLPQFTRALNNGTSYEQPRSEPPSGCTPRPNR